MQTEDIFIAFNWNNILKKLVDSKHELLKETPYKTNTPKPTTTTTRK